MYFSLAFPRQLICPVEGKHAPDGANVLNWTINIIFPSFRLFTQTKRVVKHARCVAYRTKPVIK